MGNSHKYGLNRMYKIELSKHEYAALLEHINAFLSIYLYLKEPVRHRHIQDLLDAIKANTSPIEQPIKLKEIVISESSNMKIETLPETGFLRQAQVLRLIPVGKSTWWNGIKSGRFPKSVNLGGRVTAWRVEDIKELINNLNKGTE